MGDRWGEDPSIALWERWRRPVLVLVGVILVAGQWDLLTSGRPFNVVTGVGVSLFWISWLCMPIAPKRDERTNPGAWKRHGRRAAAFSGLWLLVACAWVAVAAVLYGFWVGSLFAPAFITVLLLVSMVPLLRPEQLAEKHRELGA